MGYLRVSAPALLVVGTALAGGIAATHRTRVGSSALPALTSPRCADKMVRDSARGIALTPPVGWTVAINGPLVNGSLVVLDVQAGMGPGQAGAARILAVQGGGVARVLAREQAAPSVGGLAPSPRGLYVAYATNRSTSMAPSPQAPGLWQVSSTGGPAHLIASSPVSTRGNRLEIGPVTWSPDRYTLAYAVVVPGEGLADSQRELALGVWLTRYDGGRPRQLATNARLGITSGSTMRQVLPHLRRDRVVRVGARHHLDSEVRGEGGLGVQVRGDAIARHERQIGLTR